jgi:GNAT superfamily N-acetyltransferase
VQDDAALRRFHEIGWRAEKEDGRPWNAFWTLEEMGPVLREQTDDQRTVPLCLYDGDEMVAGGIVGMPLLDNLDKAWMFPAVEPERRGSGLGGRLLEGLLEHARDSGRTIALSSTAVPFPERETSGLLRFAERHGFRLANTEIVRVLKFPVADELLDELEREAAPHRRDYVLETYVDELPERHLAAYSHLRNQLGLDAPTGEVDWEAEQVTPEIERQKLERSKRSGRRTFITLAVRDGEAVAHSDLFVPPGSTEVLQMGTLVRRDHRGHRLGTAVKIANLRALQRACPEVTEVKTQNAETNAWMVGINVRLGFRPVGVVPEFLREI